MFEDIRDEIPEDVDEEELIDFVMEQFEDDPLFRDLMRALQKRHWINNELFDGDLERMYMLTRTILLTSSVSPSQIEYYLSTEEGEQIFQKVKSDFEEEEISDELVEEYRENAIPVLEEIDELIEIRRQKLYGDKFEEIVELEDSDREDQETIIDRIQGPIRVDPENEELVEELERLGQIRKKVDTFPYDESDLKRELPTIDGDEYWIHKHYAVQISYPRLYTPLYRFEEEYEDFPLKWLSDITVPQARSLYYQYKEGDLDESFVVDEVQRDGYFEDLLDEAEKLPPFREREDILQEVVDNYHDDRYASIINLLLPQIEFLLWIYGAYLDTLRGEDIYRNADYTNFWDFNPRDHPDLSLQNLDGGEIENPRVRDLVQTLAARGYLITDIAEYFVEELYEERNPILHGNVANYYSDLEAAKKIVFFKTIIGRVTEQLRTDIVDQIYEELPDDLSDSDSKT